MTTELPEFGELFKLQLEGIEPLTQELYDRLSEAGRDNHIVGEKSVFATLSGSNGTNIVRFMALSKMEDLAKSEEWALYPNTEWVNEGNPRFYVEKDLTPVKPVDEEPSDESIQPAEEFTVPKVEHYEEPVLEELFDFQIQQNPIITQEIFDSLSETGKSVSVIGESNWAFVVHDFLQEQTAVGVMASSKVPEYVKTNGMKFRKCQYWNKPTIPEVDRF